MSEKKALVILRGSKPRLYVWVNDGSAVTELPHFRHLPRSLWEEEVPYCGGDTYIRRQYLPDMDGSKSCIETQIRKTIHVKEALYDKIR